MSPSAIPHVGALTLACACLAHAQSPARPNILFILADDHAQSAIGAYHGRYAEIAPTPNIDRIAREGVRLDDLFCTNAICGPSRACILTGKYGHVNGFYQNEGGIVFDGTQETFPKLLRAAGYATAVFGKWHLMSTPQGFDTYKIHTDGHQQGVYWNPTFDENGKSVTEKGYATNLTADFALQWLEKERDTKKPFCLLVHFKAPHRPCEPDTKYKDLFADQTLPYPASFDDNYATREQTAGRAMMTMADYLTRGDLKQTPPAGLSPEAQKAWLRYGDGPGQPWAPAGMTPVEAKRWKYQTYVKDYLRCVRSVDDNVGRLLDYLKEKGLAENTVVLYVSDQGFYLGEHGWYDKRWMYETSFKMPALIRYPKAIPADTACRAKLLNIDFAPTLLDFAGIAKPADMQGESFAPFVTGKKTDTEGREAVYYAYYEYPKWHNVQPHYGVRTDRYKLIHFYYDRDIWEFYDLQKDPNELTNRYNDPAYATEIAALKKTLSDLQKQYGDNMPLEQRRQMTRRYSTAY